MADLKIYNSAIEYKHSRITQGNATILQWTQNTNIIFNPAAERSNLSSNITAAQLEHIVLQLS